MVREARESEIQFLICEYLFGLKKYFGWRQNTIPVYDAKSKKYRSMPKYSMKGIPDIILIKDGKFIGLEVKRKKGSLSKHQKQFRDLCKTWGAEYHVVSSLKHVRDIGL